MRATTEYRGRIVMELKERGLSMCWLAKRLQIAPETLSRKMNGKAFSETEMRLVQKLFGWKTIGGETR